jgi:hypothetical protein
MRDTKRIAALAAALAVGGCRIEEECAERPPAVGRPAPTVRCDLAKETGADDCRDFDPGYVPAKSGDFLAAKPADPWPTGEGSGPSPALRSEPDAEIHGRSRAVQQLPKSGLKGGELDDNDRFDEFLRYRAAIEPRVAGRVRPLDVSERVVIGVVDADGRPASSASIVVRDLDGGVLARRKAYADGRAMFFPAVESRASDGEFTVEASLGDGEAVASFARGTSDVRLRLDSAPARGRPALDVVFCLDCTGSMDDEIDRLKRTIDLVARRLCSLPGSPRLRLGLVRYRDRGDDFVVQTFDLTPDIERFRGLIAATEAAGGGDYPEDVQAGLAAAVEQVTWDPGPDTARLVFLIGDAPPHLYPDEPSYPHTLQRAVEKGVKCFSLAASGLDDAGELVWRQIAQATCGRFIFISYGTPDGGRGTPHHTGPYLENDLDDIVVRQCARELDALTARGQTTPALNQQQCRRPKAQ